MAANEHLRRYMRNLENPPPVELGFDFGEQTDAAATDLDAGLDFGEWDEQVESDE